MFRRDVTGEKIAAFGGGEQGWRGGGDYNQLSA